MKTKNRLKKGIALGMSMVLLMGAVTGCGSDKGKDKKEKESDTVTITNVSYDPTRELYEQYNRNNPVPWRFGFSGPFCGRG